MNSTFKTLFGIEASAVQRTCVIMPFDMPGVMKELGVDLLHRGKLFSAGTGAGLTLIRSGMGAGFVGDSVLWLEETPCERLWFLGTCGALPGKPGLSIGTVVAPKIIYPFESFSALLAREVARPEPLSVPAPPLSDMSLVGPRCVGASVSSLHEEPRLLPLFQQLGIDVIDMESHAFFVASERIRRPAAALLVISDIVGTPGLCFDLSPEHKKSLLRGSQQAATTIQTFATLP
jgi:purine-nucleoside phosphorylase